MKLYYSVGENLTHIFLHYLKIWGLKLGLGLGLDLTADRDLDLAWGGACMGAAMRTTLGASSVMAPTSSSACEVRIHWHLMFQRPIARFLLYEVSPVTRCVSPCQHHKIIEMLFKLMKLRHAVLQGGK